MFFLFPALGVVLTPGLGLPVHFESLQAVGGQLVVSPPFVAAMRACVAGMFNCLYNDINTLLKLSCIFCVNMWTQTFFV